MPPPYSFSSVGSDPEIADAEWRAYEEQERALIIEQNWYFGSDAVALSRFLASVGAVTADSAYG